MTQKIFDFNRAAQLRLLDDLDLEPLTKHARRVKAFLRAVDAAAKGGLEARVSQSRLALIAACGVATIRRAQMEAVALNLVTVERSEFESTYSINWLTVLDCGKSVENAVDKPSNPPLTVSGPPAHGERTPRSRCATPPLTVSGPPAHGERAIYHALPCNQRSHALPGGWPLEISEKSLGRTEDVERLFQHAVESHWVTDEDKLRFFTLAVSVRRRYLDGVIKSPGAAFTASVRRRNRSDRWSWGTPADEETARKMIDSLTPPAAMPCASAAAIQSIASAFDVSEPQPTHSERLADYRRRLALAFPQVQKVLPKG